MTIDPAELESLAFEMGAKAYFDRRLEIVWPDFESETARQEFARGYSHAQAWADLIWSKSNASS